jgi:hypothetical protein
MRLHYMTTQQWGPVILGDRRLKVSTIRELNDPFELLGASIGERAMRHAMKILHDHWSRELGIICLTDNWHNLPLRHGTWHRHRLCVPDPCGDGFWLCDHRSLPHTSAHRAQVARGGVDMVAVGTVTALIPVSMGIASVLYKFYLPMVGNPFYYIGVVLVVVGSWIWVGLMVVNVHAWKRANPGAPVPLPMYVNVGGSLLWGRASDETDHLRTAAVQR